MNDLPVVAGVPVNTDDQGRFNLNALHKASGGQNGKRPSLWLVTKQAQELAEELSNNSCFGDDVQKCISPFHSVKGGSSPGTYAHELLAISYAGWISPAFQLKVNQVFLDYRAGRLHTNHMPELSRREILKLAMDAEEENEKLREQLSLHQSDAEFAEALRGANGAVSLSTAAKLLGCGPRKLDAFLFKMKWLRRDFTPYQYAIKLGYMELNLVHDKTEGNFFPKPCITGKGLSALFDMLKLPTNRMILEDKS